MKQLLFIFLLFPLSVFSQDWEKYTSSVNGDVFYYDKESLKVLGEVRFVLVMTDYVKPTPYGDLSSVSYVEINCDEYTIEYKMMSYYLLPKGKGEQTTIDYPDEKMKVLRSERTVFKMMIDTVCKN